MPTTHDPRIDGSVGWRTGRLRDAGFPADLARRLAADPGYDLHALMTLTDRGCPPHLAARIVAPLSEAGDRR